MKTYKTFWIQRFRFKNKIKLKKKTKNKKKKQNKTKQDLLEPTPKKDVLFIIGDWDAKVGSQEAPGVTGKFGLEYRMKQGKGY